MILIHHMWGSHRTVQRHVKYLNSIGYDCISFDLILGTENFEIQFHPLLRYLYMGVFYIWMRQIRIVLDEIPGDKIVYSFSGSSMSAIWAIDKRTDILKLICDGGPSHDYYHSSRNMFRLETGIRNNWLNSLSAFLGSSMWGIRPNPKLHEVLDTWNPNVPILSIRGTDDNIVSIEHINQVFTPHPRLPLTIVEIKGGRHLNGLRDFPDIYTQEVFRFLNGTIAL